MFIVMIVQVLLGAGVRWIKRKGTTLKRDSGRGPSNYIHVVLGATVVLIGFATALTGE